VCVYESERKRKRKREREGERERSGKKVHGVTTTQRPKKNNEKLTDPDYLVV